MQRQLTIIKGKLDKDGNLIVSYNERLPDGNQRIVKDEENTTPVHPDLINAFQALNPHLASLCEQYNKEGAITEEIECRSFSLKGEDDSSGITLSGVRKVANNKSFAINTPFLHWGREDNYANMQELMESVEHCEDEVKEYLINGKHAADPQLSLDLDAKVNETKDPEEVYSNLSEKAAIEMVTKAGIEKGHLVLNPCANIGSILNQILITDEELLPDYCELEASNRKVLKSYTRANYVGADFLAMNVTSFYDRIIAAPPRSKSQEIDHLLKMYNVTKPGGRIVALVSTETLSGKTKPQKRFLDWINEVKALQQPIDNGIVNKDGKSAKGVILIIDKPE